MGYEEVNDVALSCEIRGEGLECEPSRQHQEERASEWEPIRPAGAPNHRSAAYTPR